MVEVVLTNCSVSFWNFFKISPDSVEHCGATYWYSWNLFRRLESSFLSVKNSENCIEIALETVTLYVVECLDLFPGHPVWQTYKNINIHTKNSIVSHLLSPCVTVCPPISTELCMHIEDVRPILHLLTFSDLIHSFCTWGPWKFW